MPGIRKKQVMWEELNALGVAGGGAYYTKAEFDAFFEGESENKKQVHWDRITSKPGTFPPSAHTLASHSTKAHSELSDAPANAHHAQIHASAHEVGGGDLVHHDDLTGFEASEHLSLPNTMANVLSSYLLDDLSNTNIGTPENGSLLQYWTSDSKWHDVVDLPPSTHASTHHSGGSDQVNHDSLLGFVAAEHVSLPNTIANVLTNHNKEIHDALDIDARYIDGKEVVAVTPTDGHVLTYVLANTRWEDKAPAPGTLAGLTDTNIGAPESGELLEYSDVDSKWHNVSLVPWAWTDVLKTGSNLTDLATRQHAGLTDVTADQHHNKVHSMTGVAHTAAGLTVGHVLRATAADAFTWGFLTKLGTIDTGVWQATPITNAYVAGIDQNLLQASSPTFLDLTVGKNEAVNHQIQILSGIWNDPILLFYPSSNYGFSLGNYGASSPKKFQLRTHDQSVVFSTAGNNSVDVEFFGQLKANQFYLNLGGLLDVNLGSLEEGETIRYDQGTTKWIDAWGVEYDNPRLVYKLYTDFFGYANTASPPWTGGGVAGGTMTGISATADHPGILKLRSGITVNSGYRFATENDAFLIHGREHSECVFQMKRNVDTKFKYGFIDTYTAGNPTDGVWLEVLDGNLRGKTANNGSISTTGTGYNLSLDTWYRIKLAVNTAATEVTYILYSAAGTQLWSNTLSTNIPTGAGRTTGHMITATHSGEAAFDLIWVDMMVASRAGTLTR